MAHGIGNSLRLLAARSIFHKSLGRAARTILGAPFSPRSDRRLLIYYHPNAICWANIYPFFHHADALAQRHGTGVRALPIDRLIRGRERRAADIVLVQPWFTEDGNQVAAGIEDHRSRFPHAKTVFVDSLANTDLRFGRHVAPHVDLYLKKALFHDRREFLKPRLGDTNLTDYYMRLYGIEEGAPVDWQVPQDLLGRLGLIQNFLMAPHMIAAFSGARPEFSARPVDLNARIATRGTPWYTAMREHAIQAARGLDGVTLSAEGRIPQNEFLAELHRSKLCWSPFGYGELCWRDIEAFMSGAVLVKPDMSHLETLPDLYRPGETYLPVRWDFSDLGDVVGSALADADLRRHIATNAFEACRNYIESQAFVSDTARTIL